MKLAIFDFDGTLFPLETIPFLLKQYTKLGYSKMRKLGVMLHIIPLMWRYKVIKKFDKETFRRGAVQVFLKLFEGMTEDEVQDFFEKNLPVVIESLDQKVLEEVHRLKEEGYYTVLLSGCFDMLINPLQSILGLDEVIGTHLLFQTMENGERILKSSVEIDIISGDRKVDKARAIGGGALIDWEASHAYADSYYDADILELVGQPIAVNPDEKLREISISRKWLILETK